jgi:glutathione synthase/RimK-type ligase-like ATP-grasp enzyme
MSGAHDAGDLGGRLAAAAALADDGQVAAAIASYAALLHERPHELEAMLRLAGLFVTQGNLAYARAVLLEAATAHPERPEPAGLLGNVLVDLGEIAAARRAYERAVEIDPEYRLAHRGLAVLAEREGQPAEAAQRWRLGYPGDGGLATSQYRGAGPPVRLLVVNSALGGNVPLRLVLDERRFVWTELFAEAYAPGMALPDDALAVNAIGDADRCARALDLADAVFAQAGGPVVNPPARVRATARATNAARLAGLPDVVAPRARTISRALLAAPDAGARLAAEGFGWPLLLRAPGFHTGEHFVRVDAATDLAAAAAALPGDELLVIAFVDTAASDGTYRKYRVLSIGGALYALHLAISHEWKVHYFSAAMAESAAFRAEERVFLEDAPGTLGARAYAALERIAALLALDYGGIDFGLDREGRVVVFEANATMALVPPGDDPRFAYRRPALDAALGAAQALLLRRARDGG